MTPSFESYEAVALILTKYFDGLYNSDITLLAEVMHERAHYVTVSDGEFLHRTMEEYFPVVHSRPSPRSRGEPRADTIISIEFAGPVTAFARVECAIGERHFIDLLTLIHTQGRWQIISKVFHFDIRL